MSTPSFAVEDFRQPAAQRRPRASAVVVPSVATFLFLTVVAAAVGPPAPAVAASERIASDDVLRDAEPTTWSYSFGA